MKMIIINEHLYFCKNSKNEWKIVNIERKVKLEINNKTIIKFLNDILEIHDNEEIIESNEPIIELLIVSMITLIEKGEK